MEAEFDIVAVSWPGQATAVAGNLPDPTRVVLAELERDQIVEVIVELGVAGPPELQRSIVDQAHGA